MKKVLILTYYWPPAGGAGVQRWLKFVKYLREFGWEPVVYTALNGEMPVIDESLQKDVPENTTVLKTTGTLNQGTLSAVTVSSTGSGRTLVGNPYASPIDFESIYNTSHLDPNFYIWDPALSGTYGVGGFRIVERNTNGSYQQTPSLSGGVFLLTIYINRLINTLFNSYPQCVLDEHKGHRYDCPRRNSVVLIFQTMDYCRSSSSLHN